MSKVGGTHLCEGGMPLPPGVGLGKPGPGCLCYAFINSERREFLGPYKTPELFFLIVFTVHLQGCLCMWLQVGQPDRTMQENFDLAARVKYGAMVKCWQEQTTLQFAKVSQSQGQGRQGKQGQEILDRNPLPTVCERSVAMQKCTTSHAIPVPIVL